MIERLEDYLVGVAIGIRFRANFSIEDQLGQIVDTILYSENSYFNPKVFPQAGGAVGQKALLNQTTDDQMRIDNSNFVLEVNFGHPDGFKNSDYPMVLSKFNEQIIRGVMTTFGIQQILRSGLVRKYIFPIHDLAQRFVDKTIGRTLEGVNDINLQFSKKMPVPEAFVKRDVNDWSNAIFNIIKRADADEIFMSIDFQLYYSPPLEKAPQIDFSPFIRAAEAFNTEKYLPWLNTNYVEG